MEKPIVGSIPTGVNRVQLAILFTTVFLDLFGFGVIIPILPILAGNLGATGFQYGLIVALFSLMQFIFAPIWGGISDRIGRRPVILIGLGGSAIGFSIFGFATELWIIYLARAVAGIFTSATLTVSYAYIADVTPPKKRGKYFGLIAAAFGLGFAVGPAVGGLMANVSFLGISGYALPSFLAALISFLNMILAYFILPESLPKEMRGLGPKRNPLPILNTGKVRAYPGVLLFITIFALSSLAFSDYIATFAFYAIQETGATEKSLGLYFTYAGGLLVISQMFFVGRMIDKFGEVNMVKTGLVLFLIGFITLPMAPSFGWFYLTNAPLMIGISFLNPGLNALISIRTPQAEQGMVLGITQGWSSFFRILGPIIGGSLFDIGAKFPFYFAGIMYVIIIIIAFTKIKSEDVTLPESEYIQTSSSD